MNSSAAESVEQEAIDRIAYLDYYTRKQLDMFLTYVDAQQIDNAIITLERIDAWMAHYHDRTFIL